MTKPNKPGPSWEKELLETAKERADNLFDAVKSPLHHAGVIEDVRFGARWAKEKAPASGEESVDDFHDLQEVEKSLRQQLAEATKALDKEKARAERYRNEYTKLLETRIPTDKA